MNNGKLQALEKALKNQLAKWMFLWVSAHLYGNLSAQSCVIELDVVVQMDSSFVAGYGGKQAAINAIDSAISDARARWDTISGLQYLININRVWELQHDTTDYIFHLNDNTFATNIVDDWKIHRSCVRYDAILYFTGHSRPWKGYVPVLQSFGSTYCNDTGHGPVAIISGAVLGFQTQRISVTTAHEIGHLLGLGHEQSECSLDCDSIQSLMCESSESVA